MDVDDIDLCFNNYFVIFYYIYYTTLLYTTLSWFPFFDRYQSIYLPIVFFIFFRCSLFQFLIHLFYENNIDEFFPSTFPFLSDLSWSLRSEQRSSSSTGVQPEREIWCDISYTQQTPLVRTYFNTF